MVFVCVCERKKIARHEASGENESDGAEDLKEHENNRRKEKRAAKEHDIE